MQFGERENKWMVIETVPVHQRHNRSDLHLSSCHCVEEREETESCSGLGGRGELDVTYFEGFSGET